jgi:hypothetical protein
LIAGIFGKNWAISVSWIVETVHEQTASDWAVQVWNHL